MIPLSLITGFLGSGKTTLLQRIVQRRRDRRYVYLINEFSPMDIDGQLIPCPPDQLITVAGGSIFCRCLVSEFIGQLQRVHGLHQPPERPIDGVIIEASGIADPKVIAQLLIETRLDQLYTLRSVISVVDPGSFGKLLHTLPNIIAQVEASTTAVINKTDLYNEAQLADTEQQLRRINPALSITRASFCDVKIDEFEPQADASMTGQYAFCRDPGYAVIEVALDRPVNLARLTETLQAGTENLYRVKGFVSTTDRQVYVDYSPAGLRIEDADAGTHQNGLVIIAPGQQPQHAQALRERIEQIAGV